MTIEDGKFVKVEYTGTLDDGTVFDSTENADAPLEFQIGSKQVITGFEAAVKEMELGEEKEVTLSPEDAYGQPRDDLIVELPSSELPEGEEISVGQQIIVTTDQGMPFPAKIVEIGDEKIKIDVNHPLAGHTLHFKLKVVEVNDTGASGCASCGAGCDTCD